MKKKMFEACGGWILTEVLLLVTAWTSHLVLVWIAAVLMVGLVFLCAESSGGRDPDSGYRRQETEKSRNACDKEWFQNTGHAPVWRAGSKEWSDR